MKREPKVITLEDASLTTKPIENKWWSDYEDKKNLVADVPVNEAWWNWKYRYTFKPFLKDHSKQSQLDDHFKKVKIGYFGQEAKEDNKQTSLNKACHEVYEKEKNSVTDSSNLKNNIKEFCSTNKNKLDQKPK